jgi:hypothetical protein
VVSPPHPSNPEYMIFKLMAIGMVAIVLIAIIAPSFYMKLFWKFMKLLFYIAIFIMAFIASFIFIMLIKILWTME